MVLRSVFHRGDIGGDDFVPGLDGINLGIFTMMKMVLYNGQMSFQRIA